MYRVLFLTEVWEEFMTKATENFVVLFLNASLIFKHISVNIL